MSPRLPRAERVAVIIWLIVGVVVWNAVYDLLLTRGIKEYLLRAALHDAGRGPAIPLARSMEIAVRDALWVSTFWACLILLAGLVTIRVMRLRETG